MIANQTRARLVLAYTYWVFAGRPRRGAQFDAMVIAASAAEREYLKP